MKLVLTLALASALTANAQVTATVKPLPSGMAEIRIQNGGASPLVAFAVRLEFSDALRSQDPNLVYGDSAVDQAATEIPPGQESTVEFGIVRQKGGAGAADPKAAAAGIYADGSTWGDPALLVRMMTRRRCLLQAVEDSIEMLAMAGKHNVPRGQLIAQFRVMESSVYHWYLTREQQLGRDLYRDMIAKLEALPDTPFGSAFPPTSFVEEQTAALNRKRVLLSDSRPSLSGML